MIERHTQWGLDLLDRYVKFVKERTEVEQAYAKQLRSLVKKYLPKRPSKDDPEFKFSQQQSFVQILQEVNDFAGQRELVAENLSIRVCLELAKYSQEMKQERKMHFQEGRRAQQQLESGFKQLENSKRKFERDCREAEKAAQTAERLDQDINATKADVEKAKQQAHIRSHMAEESKNEYAAQLQRFNRDQAHFYFSQMPQIFDKSLCSAPPSAPLPCPCRSCKTWMSAGPRTWGPGTGCCQRPSCRWCPLSPSVWRA